MSSLLNIPNEILDLIFSYLDVKSFLRLCNTCHALHQTEIRSSACFWRRAVRSLRFQNQPVVAEDGVSWHKLYRRLTTQTHVYTWGHVPPSPGTGLAQAGGAHIYEASTPNEMYDASKLGVIVDLQCGRYSITVLTSNGILCTTEFERGPHHGAYDSLTPFQDLKFPPGYPNPRERHDPATAIQQFSTLADRVLGLSDTGKIWSWYSKDHGKQIKFLGIDILEGADCQKRGKGRVKKVVAGPAYSSALIEGIGIVTWEADNEHTQRQSLDEPDTDTWLVFKADVIPGTSFERAWNLSSDVSRMPGSNQTVFEEVGEVINYVAMDGYIVFLTHTGRVYIYWDVRLARKNCPPTRSHWFNPCEEPSSLLEICVPEDTTVTALYGYDRSFALILANDEVLLAPSNPIYQNIAKRPLPLRAPDMPPFKPFKRYPCLQKRGVASLSFSDSCSSALLHDGSILLGGKQWLAGCSSIGAPGFKDDIRGLVYSEGLLQHSLAYRRLLKQCYCGLGRQVWFEEEKQQWLRFMASGGSDPIEAAERTQLCYVREEVHDVRAEVSEWIEQKGRRLEERLGVQEYNEDGLGPHFALCVSAGSRHGAALILRNDELVEKMRESCIVPDPQNELRPPKLHRNRSTRETLKKQAQSNQANHPSPSTAENYKASRRPRRFRDPIYRGASPGQGFKYIWADDPFPRLKLSNGREMPGGIPLSDWPEGPPNWNFEFDHQLPGVRLDLKKFQ